MVTARCRHHTYLRHVRRNQVIEATTGLERAGVLKELELEDQAHIRYFQLRAIDLDDRCPTHMGRDSLGRRVDFRS